MTRQDEDAALVAYLDRLTRERLPEHARLCDRCGQAGAMQPSYSEASALCQACADADVADRGYRWPVVDAKTHPAKHVRVPVQRRTGPRASRFNDLEQTT